MPVSLRPWADGDLALLRALVGDPAMMAHLGGAESAEKIRERQARYVAPGSGAFALVEANADADADMKVEAGTDPTAVGWVGFWEREWRGQTVHEVGWSVLPAFQGRGLAVTGARAVIAAARAVVPKLAVHAFPSVDNPPSNRVCERAGMELLGAIEFEYPPGHPMRCNDWAIAGGDT